MKAVDCRFPLLDPKAPRPIWYTNPYVLSFREEIAPDASVTLHPNWGTHDGFDAYRPHSFRVYGDTAPSFQIERLTFEGRPQRLFLHGHGPCPATAFSADDAHFGAMDFETCAFKGDIDMRVRNESAEALIFAAALFGSTRVSQSVIDDVARADWSSLTTPQCRAILRYSHLPGGGFPRKEANKEAMDQALIAMGLVAPFEMGGCLPTARGLAVADHLYRSSL